MAPVVFYGPFSPPANGQRIAFETFYGLLEGEADLHHVPIRRLAVPAAGPFFSAHRAWAHVSGQAVLLRMLRQVPSATVYFCPAGSARGILRDVAMTAQIRGAAGRIVGHIHSGNYEEHWASPTRRRLATWLAERVDAFVVPTETQARRVRGVVGETPVHVVTNVVDRGAQLTDREMEAAWAARADGGPLRVLYLSNFIASKGYLDLLDALALTETPVRATFVGSWQSGRDRRAFLARVDALGLGARVSLNPPVETRAGVRSLQAAHPVVALPTTYPSEAQPLAVLEGMYNGCAVLATPHASIPEYVRPGETGLLVPPHDPAALAEALDRLAVPGVAEAMGRRARAYATEAFTPARALPVLRRALGLDPETRLVTPPTLARG